MIHLPVLYKQCKKSESNLILVLMRYIFHRFYYGKILLLHPKVTVKGLRNIEAKEKIEVGIGYIGFSHKTDKTYLNINGKLKISGEYNIGRGCRFDIAENAVVTIGNGGFINCNTNLLIRHYLEIGDNCIISWGCQFLDDNLHEISYQGRKKRGNSIIIGDNVWIGCGVKIYNGTVIPDGCVIASDSIVKGIFNVEKSLIGGNPARIIKENIEWE